MSASRSLTRSFRDGPRALLWLALVLSLGLAAYFAVKHFSPAPPKSIVMVTGSPDGAYHQFGLKYQALLKLNGITLKLQPSSGSVENLVQLNAAQADVGFVQGGLGPMAIAAHSQLPDFEALEDDEQPNTPLRSLATVAHEPVWIFSRTLRLSDGLGPLKGQRVAVGVAGSGNQKVALELLSSYGVTDHRHHPLDGTVLVAEGGMAAVDALLADQIDALILVASVQSPVVQKLLASDGLRLASLHQAEGLARRLPYFETVVLKRGSVSPLLDRPNKDITLLATTTNLVIQEDLHPALAYLLLEAARQTHRAPSLLARPGEFPNSQGTDFPLAEESARYFKNGRPFLQTYLPFWMANLVQRTVLMVLPVLALLLPLIRLLPWLRTWRQSRRIYRHYGELKFLEQDLLSHQLSPEELAQARASLDRIEADVLGTRFPIDFTDRVYTLRQHVELVRRNLARAGPIDR